MAKKKGEPSGAAVTATETPVPAEAVSDTNGNAPLEEPEKQRPLRSWKYPTDRTANVEAAVWQNEVTFSSGEKGTILSATFAKHYRDEEGTWHRSGSFRGHEIPVLIHALEKAHSFMLDQRELQAPLS